ncbi:MAG: pilus assembly protein PilP [Syntrophobacterales bacterium]|nr:pilus assembly protein PilP [Syntrophobacterales bacterium]
MRLKTSGFAIAVGAAILLLVGVLSGGAADSKKPGDKGQAAAAEKTKANAVTGGASLYQYNARGKADPFKPFMETDMAVINKKAEELKKKAVAVSNKALSPLQKADIDKFLLVGIAGDQGKRMAIVEDKAAKRHYPLFIGTHIGKNDGRVGAILDDRVIVEEIVRGDQKKTKKQQVNRIEMFLHKDR